MCAKLAPGHYAILSIAFGMNLLFGSALPGVREALAEFETGAIGPTVCAADRVVGSRKEISRFQILPVVWRQYSTSHNYYDPEVAWNIASKILQDRENRFRTATGRDWDHVDLYVMWNAPGVYQRANWKRNRISPAVLERAQRFANLMQERSRRYAARD